MERIELLLDDAEYDRLVHDAPPERGDLTVCVKARATHKGQPGVVLSFTVEINGKPIRVQATTTARLFLTAARGIRGFMEREGFTDLP